MLISIKKKFVFFSNPKCGTTSIESALSPLCEIKINGTHIGKHLRPSDFANWEQLLSQQHSCKKLLKICTTRHPIDKLVSWYMYRCRPELKIKRPNRYLGETNFAQWCRRSMKQNTEEWFMQPNAQSVVDVVVPLKQIKKLEGFSDTLQILISTKTHLQNPNSQF